MQGSPAQNVKWGAAQGAGDGVAEGGIPREVV